ncbi:MAG: alpha-amylase [Treponema sp.]|nr:alpha-amylase [Treponema sp.]
METLFSDKFIYHIYPLGLCACAKRNDFSCPAGNAFEILASDLDRIKSLGVNCILIGPVFESTSHGYDTVDYFYVDRRLGNNEKFKKFCDACHEKGFTVLLDAVFNHTGRDFFAFKDLIQNGSDSKYKDWYSGINFNGRSCFGDKFDYSGWAGCMDLVKLNGDNREVQDYLISVTKHWIDSFGIDGLRLDAADVLSPSFMDALSCEIKKYKKNFWLFGEVVHGDYNDWAKKGRLDSVTNYQIYKSLWSCLESKNFFELSYNLEREFGNGGMYKDIQLYNFVDNHDVNRIASTLSDCNLIHLIYALMFCIPGIPSVYYGSEIGIKGKRGDYDDFQLRPALPPFAAGIPDFAKPDVDSASLVETIKKFSKIRSENIALQLGSYKELFVSNMQFAFERKYENHTARIYVNCDSKSAVIKIPGADPVEVPPKWIVIK